MKKEIKFYAITNITQATEKDSLYAVKSPTDETFRLIITDLNGNVVNLRDLTGGSGGSGITTLTSTDSSITITGTASTKNIQISSSLLNLINSALQVGDNISNLTNDVGYITLADIPTFNPTSYDLEDFNNASSNLFVRVNDLATVATTGDYGDLINIPLTFPPSSHTHSISEITGLQTALDGKFDNPTGLSTDYLDGEGNPQPFPTITGATNLGYTASPTQGVVTSDTGTDATIPLADNTNAGLLTPTEKGQIASALQPGDLAGYVPYTGATTDVDLGEHQIKAGQLEFDQTPTGTFGVGKVRWNDTDGTTERRLKGNNVTLQDGLEVLKRVVNKTGANLLESEYKVVRLRNVSEGGAQGQRSAVVLAQANSSVNSNALLGVVTENINDNQEGFITLIGEVREINTTGSLQGETWVDGDQLYLSATVAGELTNIVPSSPNYSIPIATVDHAHNVNGKISVHTGERLSLDVALAGDNNVAPSVTAVKTYIDTLLTERDYLPVIYEKHANVPVFGSASVNNLEGVALVLTGATSRTFADTNLYSRRQRIGLVSPTTASAAQARQTALYFNRNSTFKVIVGLGFNENCTASNVRGFAGVCANVGTFGNIEPTTLTNCFGIAKLSTSNNVHVIHNDGSGTATAIDLGTSFPSNTIATDFYIFEAETSGSNIVYKVTRENTGDITTGTITTDLPATTQGLNLGFYIVQNTGANTNTGIDFFGTNIIKT